MCSDNAALVDMGSEYCTAKSGSRFIMDHNIFHSNTNNQIHEREDKRMTNKVIFSGMLLDNPVFSHKDAGKKFYRARIAYSRINSDKKDIIPVAFKEDFIRSAGMKIGAYVKVIGKYCSRIFETKNKGTIRRNYILANDVIPWFIDTNEAEIVGIVEKDPVLRKLPNGKSVCEITLVNKLEFSTYYLPTVFWKKNVKPALELKAGDVISVEGMLQSRMVRKTSESGDYLSATSDLSVFSFKKLESDTDV